VVIEKMGAVHSYGAHETPLSSSNAIGQMRCPFGQMRTLTIKRALHWAYSNEHFSAAH